jgi:hypothetical protein
MHLPFKKTLYLRHADGRRELCCATITEVERDGDGMFNVELDCPNFFARPLRTNGDSLEEAAAHAFQFLRSLIRNLELSCEDEAGQAVTLPCGKDIDPTYSSEEELLAELRRRRSENTESGQND